MSELTLQQIVVPKSMAVFTPEVFEDFLRTHGEIYERGPSAVFMWMSGWILKRALEGIQESKELRNYQISTTRMEFIHTPAPDDQLIVSGTWVLISSQYVRLELDAKNQNHLTLVHSIFDLQAEKTIDRKQS